MSAQAGGDRQYPAQRAFVVQFGRRSGTARDQFTGRVEHVASGKCEVSVARVVGAAVLCAVGAGVIGHLSKIDKVAKGGRILKNVSPAGSRRKGRGPFRRF